MFLEDNSLSTTNYTIYSDVGLDNKLTEGCTYSSLIIQFDDPVSNTTTVPMELITDVDGQSADMTDFTIESSEFILQAGESRADIKSMSLMMDY